MSVPAVEQMVPALVEVVEAGPELVELLLGDALAVPGQDLVLHLVDGPTQFEELNILVYVYLKITYNIIPSGRFKNLN